MKSYLSEDAALIRSCVPESASVPEGTESLFLIYAVLMRSKGERVDASDVHDAWSAWMQIEGKRHISLISFEQLDVDTQLEDLPYVEAIRRAAQIKQASST